MSRTGRTSRMLGFLSDAEQVGKTVCPHLFLSTTHVSLKVLAFKKLARHSTSTTIKDYSESRKEAPCKTASAISSSQETERAASSSNRYRCQVVAFVAVICLSSGQLGPPLSAGVLCAFGISTLVLAWDPCVWSPWLCQSSSPAPRDLQKQLQPHAVLATAQRLYCRSRTKIQLQALCFHALWL